MTRTPNRRSFFGGLTAVLVAAGLAASVLMAIAASAVAEAKPSGGRQPAQAQDGGTDRAQDRRTTPEARDREGSSGGAAAAARDNPTNPIRVVYQISQNAEDGGVTTKKSRRSTPGATPPPVGASTPNARGPFMRATRP